MPGCMSAPHGIDPIQRKHAEENAGHFQYEHAGEPDEWFQCEIAKTPRAMAYSATLMCGTRRSMNG